ncbi:MAG TPA: hypothetical protein VJU87_06595 [Gemmatimonadaceae bacterium]|nr:hypothetical protein [Gemmatimonadaceae bacterium]
MRVGDFSVEIVPRGSGSVRELDSGHVLARPGQVYALRLRNAGPLRCVAEVRIDGHLVSAGGLVLEPWGTEELERPLEDRENGRFTVIAEGDERVFGPDGGRDNADLGLVEVRFRRELPRGDERPVPPVFSRPIRIPELQPPSVNGPSPSRFPAEPSPREWWFSPQNRLSRMSDDDAADMYRDERDAARDLPAGLPESGVVREIERAAGTGLSGHSDQRFVPVRVGPLETEATVIRLRLVIGTVEAIDAPRPLCDLDAAPARPAARP